MIWRTVIVTGSRGWPHWQSVFNILTLHAPTLLVHGACPSGVDSFAETWAKQFCCAYHGIPAIWKPDGVRLDRGAGFKRNVRMLEENPGVPVLAFHYKESPGTAHCIRAAEKREHPVKVYDVAGELVRRSGPRIPWLDLVQG